MFACICSSCLSCSLLKNVILFLCARALPLARAIELEPAPSAPFLFSLLCYHPVFF